MTMVTHSKHFYFSDNDGLTTNTFSLPTNKAHELSNPSESYRLLVFKEEHSPYTIHINAGKYILGRSLQSDIRIDHESISRSHASLSYQEGWFIEDLNSRNGTRLNTLVVQPHHPQRIRSGSVFEIGAVMCVLQRILNIHQLNKILDYKHFYLRIQDDCLQFRHHEYSFSLLRLRFKTTETSDSIQKYLTQIIDDGDIAALYSLHDWHIALYAPASILGAKIDRMIHHINSVCEVTQSAFVLFPQDGVSVDELYEKLAQQIYPKPTISTLQTFPVQSSLAMKQLDSIIDRVAKSELNVLFQGETGVGKEIKAKQLHRLSFRKNKPFLGINCAALPELLLESELFGHEKGAFTGATNTKIGLFEAAQGGSIFLDEIAEMALPVQAKLLRVIEEKTFLRVGGIQERNLDVRFIAASHRDLEEEVNAGRFREDLYYRLNGMTLFIPALRERPDEILQLINQFLIEFSNKNHKVTTHSLSLSAQEALLSYKWPGNIRELRNVIERAVVLAPSTIIEKEHLSLNETSLLKSRVSSRETIPSNTSKHDNTQATSSEHILFSHLSRTITPQNFNMNIKEAWREEEKIRILHMLEECAGNQTQAAKKLGISRRTLLLRLDTYGIKRPRKIT